MSAPLTLAQMRDRIRRNLQITPPVDSGGLAGAVPAAQPNPSNPAINDAINEAVAWVNALVGWRVQSVNITVTAITANGPAAYPLTGALSVAENINTVRSVVWNDGTGNPIRLEAPTSDVDLDRAGYQYQLTAPSVPRQWWVLGYTLYVVPAPAVAGTLTLSAGTGIYDFVADTDTVTQLPVDFQNVIPDRAVWRLSAQQTEDAEAAPRAAAFQNFAMEWIARTTRWMQSQEVDRYQPSLVFGGWLYNQARLGRGGR